MVWHFDKKIYTGKHLPEILNLFSLYVSSEINSYRKNNSTITIKARTAA